MDKSGIAIGMSLQILNVFHLCIIVFSWLFGSVLCTRQSLANRFLGIFLLVLGLQMLQYLLFDLGLLLNHRWRGFLGIVFLYGPLIYGYVKALLQPDFSLSRRYGVHLLPTVCCMLAGWVGMDVRHQLGWGLYLSLGFYLLLSFRLLLVSPVTARVSNLPEKRRWIAFFLGVFSLVLLVDFLSFVSDQFFFAFTSWSIIDEVVVGLALLFVVVLVWKGLVKPQLFGEHNSDAGHNAPGIQRRRTINEDQSRSILDHLEHIMQTEAPYRNPELTLGLLAARLEIPSRQLSEVVNQSYRQNVSEYINTHRLEWAKNRLLQPADPGETILEVLYEAGFNSKSSFNTLFKRSTGMTPSQFKKQGGSQQNS